MKPAHMLPLCFLNIHSASVVPSSLRSSEWSRAIRFSYQNYISPFCFGKAVSNALLMITLWNVWEDGGIAPHIHIQGVIWKWVASFTLRPLYHLGNCSFTNFIGGWCCSDLVYAWWRGEEFLLLIWLEINDCNFISTIWGNCNLAFVREISHKRNLSSLRRVYRFCWIQWIHITVFV